MQNDSPAKNTTVLVLGADGFIGRHIAFALRDAGYSVIAHARKPGRLRHMGFSTFAADLTDPECHSPAFWADVLKDGTHLVNAAGLLSGSPAAFEAVHVYAPKAAYAALSRDARTVLISAIGIEADTPFAQWRRQGEGIAPSTATLLRPGLVLAGTSYGGSSLARALAVFPLATPLVGDGQQSFNPIHAKDLAAIVLHCLQDPPPAGPHLVGGPEQITQSGLSQMLRQWMGLRPVPVLCLPLPLAQLIGRIGDVLRLGPISKTSVDQLSHGVLAPLSPKLASAPPPRGVREFIMERPAGSQDLWHARLYLMRPIVRLSLAMLWLISGLLGLFLSADAFLPLLDNSVFPDPWLVVMARGGGCIDLIIAIALFTGWRLPLMAWAQFAMVGGYTLGFTLLAPALWLLPMGGLLKNLPVLCLIAIWAILERER